jgi:aerobic carbon-monoxide dehydrogenase large subunit
LRLITGDIGGSYGLRGSVYPEIILMLWAARRVGRPVKWAAGNPHQRLRIPRFRRLLAW